MCGSRKAEVVRLGTNSASFSVYSVSVSTIFSVISDNKVSVYLI